MKTSLAVEPQSQDYTAPENLNLDISNKLEIAERRLRTADTLLRFQERLFWSPRYQNWRLDGVHFDTFEAALDAAVSEE
jgi:hypothetical protein